ncbi:MAG: long-chain fatty acid--CoA ligase [Saprospiraceae bacterium]|nr:long-chain fatty acid--CoA ligase [Saprospiraceae bacterium]
MDFTRLFEILEYQQQRFPQEFAMAGWEDGSWHTWTVEKAILTRDRFCLGMLRLGFQPGDRVGILARGGSPQWAITDAGLAQLGIISVPIHADARVDEIGYITRYTGLKGCFVGNREMVRRLHANHGMFQGKIIGFEPAQGSMRWSELVRPEKNEDFSVLKKYRDAVKPEDLATIIFTSGSTGYPRGVMLSHNNIISNIKSVLAIVPLKPGMRALSFLPMSHVFERMVSYVYQASGVSVWYLSDLEYLPATLRIVRPHIFTAVPRILENAYDRLMERRSRLGWLEQKMFDWAVALGDRFPYAGKEHMPLWYRVQRLVAILLVFRHWRKMLGGRVQTIAVGAAALQPRLARLFSAAGIEVREGYGLTETSPVVSFNRFEPGGVYFGTVGIPAPGVEVRIWKPDADGIGEIHVRGPNVMMGYWREPKLTQKRMAAGGWLKTGDLGEIVNKRFLRITGRMSEVFKTSSGKFVAPAYVEQQINTSPFIDNCMVIGLNRPFVGALIVPDFARLEQWCRENKIHWTSPMYMVLNPKVQKLYREEIERINETLNSAEKVQKHTLMYEPWTALNGMLTPTLKLRRRQIELRQREAITYLYRVVKE